MVATTARHLRQRPPAGFDRGAQTGLSAWLHLMPRLPVSDMDRSIAYYQEALGFRLAWRTVNGTLSALAIGEIEILLLTSSTLLPPVTTACAPSSSATRRATAAAERNPHSV